MTNLPKPNSLPESAEKVFNGRLFDIYQWPQTMFDGSTVTFERAVRPSSTHVLAVTKAGKILINREQQPNTGVFYSLPGGRLEQNLTPEENAQKELLEETGHAFSQLELLYANSNVPKVITTQYQFLAKGCYKIQEQDLDFGEKVEVLEVTFEEFLELIVEDSFRGQTFTNFIFKQHFLGKLEEFKNKILA